MKTKRKQAPVSKESKPPDQELPEQKINSQEKAEEKIPDQKKRDQELSQQGILDQIVAHKKNEIAARKKTVPLETFLQNAQACSVQNQLVSVIESCQSSQLPCFILELKPHSPSEGVLQKAPDSNAIILAYNAYGHAISVLTDAKYFGGSLDLLKNVVHQTAHPVLCKDFIIDPYQIYEARAAGAQVILLIVKALDDVALKELTTLCRTLGMTPLIEVQTEAEVKRALEVNPQVLLINNRNLQTLAIDLSTTRRLSALIPEGIYKLSASGIKTREDIESLLPFCDGFLMGSTLMKTPVEQLPETLQHLTQSPGLPPSALSLASHQQNNLPLTDKTIKICGITNEADAKNALQAGATLLGFIFVPSSPRYVSPEKAREIIQALKSNETLPNFGAVGVFQDDTADAVNQIAGLCALDFVQLHGKESLETIAAVKLPVIKALALPMHEFDPLSEITPVSETAPVPKMLHESESTHLLDSLIADYLPAINTKIIALLIDLPKTQQTGQTHPRKTVSNFPEPVQMAVNLVCRDYPVILAGNLTPESVSPVIRQFRPLGIDVASGVEFSPGIKDPAKLQLFCDAARKAWVF
ncbi:MAG: hypothetical protein AAGI66_08215 [Cyanobacteria bacterium P01_H01_bin.74]